MAKDLLIGSHVGMNGPDYYLGSVKEAISYGATTFMFYTGAPQNTFRIQKQTAMSCQPGQEPAAMSCLRGIVRWQASMAADFPIFRPFPLMGNQGLISSKSKIQRHKVS